MFMKIRQALLIGFLIFGIHIDEGEAHPDSTKSYFELNAGANYTSELGFHTGIGYYYSWSIHHIGVGLGFIDKSVANSFAPGLFTSTGPPHVDHLQLLSLLLEYRFGMSGNSTEAYWTLGGTLNRTVASSHYSNVEGGEDVPYDGDVGIKFGMMIRHHRISVAPEYHIIVSEGFPDRGDHGTFQSRNSFVLGLGIRLFEWP